MYSHCLAWAGPPEVGRGVRRVRSEAAEAPTSTPPTQATTRGTPPPSGGTRRRREAGERPLDFDGGARHGSTPPRASANLGAAERGGLDSRGRPRLVHTKGAHTWPEAVQVQQTCHRSLQDHLRGPIPARLKRLARHSQFYALPQLAQHTR